MEKSRKEGRKDMSLVMVTGVWYPGLHNLRVLLPNPHSHHGPEEQQGRGHGDPHDVWNGSFRAPGVLRTLLSTTKCPGIRIIAKSGCREEKTHFSDSLLTLIS